MAASRDDSQIEKVDCSMARGIVMASLMMGTLVPLSG
jgi:hypothetical protein